MQIYFGVTDCNELFNDTFQAKNDIGEKGYYLYGIDYGSNNAGLDGITIYDTANRSIPIDIDSVPELILALQDVLVWQQEVDEAVQFLNKVQSSEFKTNASTN